jgi:hypothetical protein
LSIFTDVVIKPTNKSVANTDTFFKCFLHFLLCLIFLHFTLYSDLINFFHVYLLTNHTIYKEDINTMHNSKLKVWALNFMAQVNILPNFSAYLLYRKFVSLWFFHDTGVWTQGFTGAISNTILMFWIMHITYFDHIHPYYSPFPFP